MSRTILYDDAAARRFAPFALTRPVGELRVGALLQRERWLVTLGRPVAGFVGAAHLRDFDEPDAASAHRGALAAGDWLVNARCAPRLDRLTLTPDIAVLRCAGRVAAVRLATDLALHRVADGTLTLESLATGVEAEVAGWWLDRPWDIIGRLTEMLAADIPTMLPARPRPDALTVLGTHPVHVESGARIEPHAVADATQGPILVREGAVIQAFTRLVGPCVIGPQSTVLGGRVAASSIGPQVKVAGEMSVCVMIGHANKGHDGFVGHSVIGRWANLGAGTITSNLKNSYGEVTMWAPDGVQRTGLQFLGSLIGDHAKTGIGTRLSTGSVIGAGANVFGTRMPPKVVPPFAWGDGEPWDTFELRRFLDVAERVMSRRQVSLPAHAAEYWAAVYDLREEA